MTSSSQSLLDLAARAEAAEGADRELDEAIALAVHDGAEIEIRMHNYIMEPDPWLRRLRPGDPNFSSGYSLERLPRYTASIDSARTLVPSGWSIGIHQQDSGWVVELRKGYNTSYSAVVFSETRPGKRATAPALALCAASLRARAQEQSA